jgi:hypothetical protein
MSHKWSIKMTKAMIKPFNKLNREKTNNNKLSETRHANNPQ